MHDSSPVCENCGKSDKRLLQHEYTCMSCGVIDGSVMIVDEMSEQRRQWDNGDDHQHQHHTNGAPAAKLPRLHTTCVQRGTDSMSNRVFAIAKRAAQLFSIETDQIPHEAACLYIATRHEGGHVSMADVVACTMIAAQRRTAQDLQDASLAFTLKSKQVMTTIERVQESVLMGDAHLASAYGYLFHTVGERRSGQLVKEALEHLVGVMLSEESRRTLLSSSWGIRSLADDMMKHVQDCRLTGGDSLDILARAMVIISCELHLGQMEVPPKAFISTCLLHTHRCTWKVALARWPGGGPSAFDMHVLQKRRLREYGSARPQLTHIDTSRCDTESVITKRNTRAAVVFQFASESRFKALDGTSTATGVTHVCVAMVSNNPTLQRYIEQDPEGIATMMDVCLAAVLPYSTISIFVDPCISSLITHTRGFEYAVCLARKFKSPVSSACFMPRELMRWGV